MALTLLSKSYGTGYAGLFVQVREALTKAPTRVYKTVRGGLLSADGRVKLDATGSMTVYVNDTASYDVTVFDNATGNAQQDGSLQDDQQVNSLVSQTPSPAVTIDLSQPRWGVWPLVNVYNQSSRAQIQAVLDYAYSTGRQSNVIAPPARYFLDAPLYVPNGVSLLGHWATPQVIYSTVFQACDPWPGGDLIRFKNTVSDGVGGYLWSGRIGQLALIGAHAGNVGYGINALDDLGHDVEFQDITLLHDIYSQFMGSGGFRFVRGVPNNFARLRPICNGGPGITLVGDPSVQHTVTVLHEISGDANHGGLIRIKDHDSTHSVVIIGAKSERINCDAARFMGSGFDSWLTTLAGTHDGQKNVVTFDNSAGAVVTVVGGHSISNYAPGGTLTKAGDFFAVVDVSSPNTKWPTLSWKGVVIRNRGTETAGIAPNIATNVGPRGLAVPATRSSGELTSPNIAVPNMTGGASSNYRVAYGAATYANPSVEDTGVQITGNTPALTFNEEDAGTNLKTWAFTASGGSFQVRSVDDSGVSDVGVTIGRTAGLITGWNWKAGAIQNFGEGTNFQLGTATGTQIGTGTTQKLAFYGSTPVVKPSVTGAKGGNAALASLLTQLAALGLITDSSGA